MLSDQLWAWSHAQGYFIRSDFSVPTDQNFIPKASPPREEWLDLLQIREEKGIKMLDKQP